MRIMRKLLSVAVALSLCASLAAPALAASFDDLQDAIDGNTETGERIESDREDHYGYDKDEDGKYGVESWKNDGGGRDVQINEKVEYDSEKDENTTITVKDDVTIDLNGNDIDGGYKAGESDGSKDSVITVTDGADLTIKDSSEDQSGTITGGNAVGTIHENKAGGGVYVADGSLTLDGGTISGNYAEDNGGGVYVGKGSFTMEDGKISDNATGNAGGGIYLNTELSARDDQEAKFVMNGGEISNNTAGSTTAGTGSGGGIGAVTYEENKDQTQSYDTIIINGGAITGNVAGGEGGGIASTNGTVVINGKDDAKVEISGNTAGNNGGGIYSHDSKVTINNANISGNRAESFEDEDRNTKGGGIYSQGGSTVEVRNSTISGNEAKYGGGIFNYQSNLTIRQTNKMFSNTATGHSDDLYNNNSGTDFKLTLYVVTGMDATLEKDGKPVTGWYTDGSTRWGDGYTEFVLAYQPGTVYKGGILCLKAAHDEYFDVEYIDGLGGALFENQTYEVENKNPIPVFGGEIPVRPGYTFAGWLVDDENFDPESGIVTGTLTLVAAWIPVPEEPEVPVIPEEPVVPEEPEEPVIPEEPVVPEVPVIPGDTDDTDAADDGTTIDETAVPLASGPVTRAEFVDYLWRHEGQPAPVADSGLFEDVTEEHTYSPAMAWAKSIGIIKSYEDGTFEPDELVTVSAARGILTRYAAYLGIKMPELTALVGEDDELVLNCDEVISEFFGE